MANIASIFEKLQLFTPVTGFRLAAPSFSLSATLDFRPCCSPRLKPYGILATGPRTGLVEFVSGSQPVSAVLSAHNGSILE